MSRRWKRVVMLLLLVFAANAIFVGANRPDTKIADAESAAVTTEYGTDPSAGADASCQFKPDAALLVWRARYHCTVGICDDVLAQLDITHVLLGGWSFRVTSGGRPGEPTSGDTEAIAGPSRADRGNC